MRLNSRELEPRLERPVRTGMVVSSLDSSSVFTARVSYRQTFAAAATDRLATRSVAEYCPEAQGRQQALHIAKQVEVAMPMVGVASRATRSRIYLRSRRHEPSQSAGGGSSRRLSMRFANVMEGPSSGTASSAALKALRASSQRRARYAASPSEY
jgi:hypothetical protein